MAKNTQVETAQKSQATNKNNIPTGKVKTLKSAEERRKTREEQFRNFRINALKRRCARMKYTEEQTEEFVKKLIEQMDAPKEYSIIILINGNEMKMMSEALVNAKINYTHKSAFGKKPVAGYFAFVGDKQLLDKLREIAPSSSKFQIYAKKMESVLPKAEPKVKKPTNNTAERKAAAKLERKAKNMRVHASDVYRDSKGRFHKRRKPSPRPNTGTNSTKVRIGKRAWKKARTTEECVKLSELIAKQKATAIQLKAKKSSMSSKKASTNLKKAA